MDSTNGSEFLKFCCGFHKFYFGFRKVDCFWSDFEQYRFLAICPNPKQQKRSEKSSNFADFCFWPVAESASNSQNAQLGFFMS